MFRQSKIDNARNRFIRGGFRQVRTEANESQEVRSKGFGKSRVSKLDMYRGRVEMSASDLGWIAAHYNEPISFFYPRIDVNNKGELSPLDQELLFLNFQLPETQKRIAIEYLR